MPPIEETPVRVKTEDRMDRLFGREVEEEETPDVVDDAVEDEEEIEEVEEVEEIEDEDESEEEDSEEDDYETPVKKKDEVPADEDEDPKDETMARKMAKERGREAKELKTKLTERELEVEKLRSEKEALEARVNEIEAIKVNPREHPDFVALQNEVLSDAATVARRLPGRAKTLLTHGNNFGELMSEYMAFAAAEGEDLLQADTKLATAIVSKLELSDVPFEDLDDEEKRVIQPSIDRVLDVLERNLPKTRDLEKLYHSLSERAKTGTLSMSVREYSQTVAEFQPILDKIGDLPDDVIETDPHSIESLVAKLVKESPEAEKRLKNAKRDALEVIVGPRALTQDEIDRLEANGTDVKKFIVERAKAHRQKQLKLLPLFVQALVTRSTIKEKLEKLAKLENASESESSEFDALNRTTKKKAPKVEPEKKRDLRPGSSLNKLFGPED